MSAHRAGCLAVRCCDQEACGFCGLQWDHDDPDPPACRREELEYVELEPMEQGGGYSMSCPLYDESSERIRSRLNPRHRWIVVVARYPVIIRGPRQPDRLVPYLSVDGFPCGPLCAPVPDTARGRLDLWELVLRLNVRRS